MVIPSLYNYQIELLSTNSTGTIRKLDPGLYQYLTSKESRFLPTLKPIGVLFPRSLHSSCLVLLVMKVCFETKKFVKFMMFRLVESGPFCLCFSDALDFAHFDLVTIDS